MNKFSHVVSQMLILAATLSCSASPEDKTSGRCALSCNNARVGGSEFVVEALTSPNLALHCRADFSKSTSAAVEGPMTVRYRVYELISQFGSTEPPATSAGAAAPTAATPTNDQPIISKRQAGGIGFEPEVHGLVSMENSAPEFKLSATKVSSAKYAGIVTPESEWCSDSCGVITFEFWPMCISATSNTLTASVAVGAAAVPAPVNFTLANP